MTDPEIRISPDPSPEDREAILRAVRDVLEQEARRALPAPWTLAGWTHKRAGVTDLGRVLSDDRRWVLSARLPWGGRNYPGLIGRGDTK